MILIALKKSYNTNIFNMKLMYNKINRIDISLICTDGAYLNRNNLLSSRTYQIHTNKDNLLSSRTYNTRKQKNYSSLSYFKESVKNFQLRKEKLIEKSTHQYKPNYEPCTLKKINTLLLRLYIKDDKMPINSKFQNFNNTKQDKCNNASYLLTNKNLNFCQNLFLKKENLSDNSEYAQFNQEIWNPFNHQRQTEYDQFNQEIWSHFNNEKQLISNNESCKANSNSAAFRKFKPETTYDVLEDSIKNNPTILQKLNDIKILSMQYKSIDIEKIKRLNKLLNEELKKNNIYKHIHKKIEKTILKKSLNEKSQTKKILLELNNSNLFTEYFKKEENKFEPDSSSAADENKIDQETKFIGEIIAETV